VESIGKNITQFKIGDEIFGNIFGCGFDAYVEYVSVPENLLVLKPVNLSLEDAGAVPEASLVALHALRNLGHIKKDQKVLVYGF
jgi:NADPH:quinone reductase-like Zn-dependent oxidoreductase